MPDASTLRPSFADMYNPAASPRTRGILQKRLYYHLAFWMAYYVFAALISLTIHHIYDLRFYWQLLTLVPPDVLLVYVNLEWLIPRLLFRRKMVSYILLLSIAILLQSALYIWLHGLYAQAGTDAFKNVQDLNLRNISLQALNAIYLIGLTMGLKFVKDRMIDDQRLQEKEKQHVETELDLLKTQIHPHFFFNTLNNLYSLTIQRSEQAPEIVLRLSDLMSYMLYESAAPMVPLEKEIATLENYIAIESLRFGNRLKLDFTKPDNVGSTSIPPLLLLGFVENSFKHSWQNHILSVHISIHCRIEPGFLHFEVRNPMPDPAATSLQPLSRPPAGKSPAIAGTGIGLRNTIRRLDLLYGTTYRLDISDQAGIFAIHLKIPLQPS